MHFIKDCCVCNNSPRGAISSVRAAIVCDILLHLPHQAKCVASSRWCGNVFQRRSECNDNNGTVFWAHFIYPAWLPVVLLQAVCAPAKLAFSPSCKDTPCFHTSGPSPTMWPPLGRLSSAVPCFHQGPSQMPPPQWGLSARNNLSSFNSLNSCEFLLFLPFLPLRGLMWGWNDIIFQKVLCKPGGTIQPWGRLISLRLKNKIISGVRFSVAEHKTSHTQGALLSLFPGAMFMTFQSGWGDIHQVKGKS